MFVETDFLAKYETRHVETCFLEFSVKETVRTVFYFNIFICTRYSNENIL